MVGREGAGGRFGHFLADRGAKLPYPAAIKYPVAPKFSRPIRLLDSFTQNLSIMISIKISIMIEIY